MRKVYDRILDMRGNLITVAAESVGMGELAVIYKKDGTRTLASVLRFEEEMVTLQVFEEVRGISTGDKVVFLRRLMQATFSDALLGRCLKGTGEPLDRGPEIVGKKIRKMSEFE